LLIMLGLGNGNAFAQEATDAAAEAVKVLPNYGGLAPTAFWALITVIASEVLVIFVLLLYINRMKRELMPEPAKKSLALVEWWKRMDKKVFTNAVAVEKESEIELAHNYDGIKELDNALPPWWKWGFIITIGISVLYMLNFHVFGSGKNQLQEYEVAKTNCRNMMMNWQRPKLKWKRLRQRIKTMWMRQIFKWQMQAALPKEKKFS